MKTLVQEAIFLHRKDFAHKVLFADILYLVADNSTTTVFTAQQGKFSVSVNLKTFLAQVHSPTLVRVHRSYAVNLNQVTGIDKRMLYIQEKLIPVSQSYHAQLKGAFFMIKTK
ncbi:MAG: LytR/AlgR family response regulator transcription factor [Saprospiraceae bacterium]